MIPFFRGKRLPLKRVVFLILIFTTGCSNKNISDLFNPDSSVDLGDLRFAGFHFVDDWNMFQKTSGDTTYLYYIQPETDDITYRQIFIENWAMKDSVELSKWIQSKSGRITSPIHDDNEVLSFTVIGRDKQYLSTCYVRNNKFEVIFEYSGD